MGKNGLTFSFIISSLDICKYKAAQQLLSERVSHFFFFSFLNNHGVQESHASIMGAKVCVKRYIYRFNCFQHSETGINKG